MFDAYNSVEEAVLGLVERIESSSSEQELEVLTNNFVGYIEAGNQSEIDKTLVLLKNFFGNESMDDYKYRTLLTLLESDKVRDRFSLEDILGRELSVGERSVIDKYDCELGD